MEEIERETNKIKLEHEIQSIVNKIFNDEDYNKTADTEKIIENGIKLIDAMNQKYKITDKGMHEYLEYMYKYKKDKKDTSLMVTLANKYNQKYVVSNKHEYKKSKGKDVDYEIVDMLEGFCVKSGTYRWNEDKINAFIESLK